MVKDIESGGPPDPSRTIATSDLMAMESENDRDEVDCLLLLCSTTLLVHKYCLLSPLCQLFCYLLIQEYESQE